jgi:hypothetical protein
VPWQNVGQKNRKSATATIAPPAIGAKHTLATEQLAVGFRGIVAVQKAVPVQCFNFSAAGAALLLERKNCSFNSSLSRTK